MDEEDKKQDGVRHYVCNGGCNGVSLDDDANCQAVDCPKHGKPLQLCTCSDEKHEEVLYKRSD